MLSSDYQRKTQTIVRTLKKKKKTIFKDENKTSFFFCKTTQMPIVGNTVTFKATKISCEKCNRRGRRKTVLILCFRVRKVGRENKGRAAVVANRLYAGEQNGCNNCLSPFNCKRFLAV